MHRETRTASWWFAGALVACVLLGSAAYVRFFVVDALVGELACSSEGGVTIRLLARRTFPAFPWLPEAELVVSGPRGEWRTSVLDPPQDPSGRTAASGTFATRSGALLVRDGGWWRAYELSTGAPVPLAQLEPVAGVVAVIAQTATYPSGAAHGIDAATGEERWVVEVYAPGCCEPPRLAAFGTTELVVGERFVDAATGARRPPADGVYAVDDLGDELVWLEWQPWTLLRRRAAGPARRVLAVPLAEGVQILAHHDDLIVALHRNTEWSPGVARREHPERVTLGDLHGRDETVILALAPDDSVRWAVASAGALGGSCALEHPAAVRIDLQVIVGSAFERRSFEIDLARGDVSSAARECPDEKR